MILLDASKNQAIVLDSTSNQASLEHMELSVIIPAYNGEKEIEETVRSVFSYLNKHNLTHEIIVVPDGAKDRTGDIVKQLTASIPTLKLIEYPHNRGKGYAVRKGM